MKAIFVKREFGILAFLVVYMLLLELMTNLLHFHVNSAFAAILIQDLPILLLLLLFNVKFFKQKILFDSYPIGKTMGLNFLTILYLVIAFAMISHEHSSILTVLSNVITIAVVAITEEFIFRGLILGNYVKRGKNLWLAVGISSVYFGLTHLINLTHQNLYNTSLQVIYAIALGILLATIYLKTNNFIYPVLLHFSIDFAAITVGNGNLNSTSATPISVLILCIMIAAIVVPYLLTGKKQLAKFRSNMIE